MKKLFIPAILSLLFCATSSAQTGMGIGTNSPAEQLDVVGAIKIGTDINNGTGAPAGGAGTIRYKSNTFEGWDGSQWVGFGSGGGGSDDQNLTGATLTGTSLQIDIESGTSATVNLSSLEESADITQVANDLSSHETNDGDLSSTNEIQTISLSGTSITLSDGGGTITVPVGTSLTDDDNDTKVQVEEASDEDKIRFDTGGSERMIIDNNGNVGVGTSSPVNLLHVQNNVSGLNFPLFLRNSSITNGDGAGIGFLSEPNGNWTKAGLYYERTGGFGTGKLHFLVDNVADNGSVTLSESRLTIKPDGNVGIGSTAPAYQLSVNTDLNGSNGIWNQNSNSGASAQTFVVSANNNNDYIQMSMSGPNYPAAPYLSGQGYVGTSNAQGLLLIAQNPSAPVKFSAGNSTTPQMTLSTSGNLGVGTTSPGAKLAVNGGGAIYNANEIQFYNDAGTTQKGTIGQYTTNSDMVLASNQSGQWLRIGANNSSIAFFPDNTYAGGSNPDVIISSDGRIGVGTTSPIAPLHVESTSTASYGNFWFYSGSGYAGGACCGGSISGVAIHANGRVMASEFDAFSDARIKNVIGVSNSEEDLNRLLGIEITDYLMKDAAKNVKPYKKVIAQQIEEVYPQAVSTITDVIPDIYAMATMQNGYIDLPADVKVGDRVKLISEEGTDMAVITSIDDAGFTVDMKASKEVFVYGREVNDFRTVDYEAISMLNVSATQELYKLIRELRSENTKLKASVAEFKTMAEDIENLKKWTNFEQQSNYSEPKN